MKYSPTVTNDRGNICDIINKKLNNYNNYMACDKMGWRKFHFSIMDENKYLKINI